MENPLEIQPYGTWRSPLAAADVARAGVRYGLCRMDGETLYWSELRPEAGPRAVIVRCDAAGSVTDVNPEPYSARSRVHEYGGGEFAVGNGRVVFVNGSDQDLYLIDNAAPARLTEAPDWRFADMVFAPDGQRILAVGERHEPGPGHAAPQNAIVSVATDAAGIAVPDLVLAGRDFYASPRISADGRRLAWLAWDLPHMPWTAAELWVADLDATGAVARPRHIAGGGGTGAFQPEWLEDGRLAFVADHEGWGNLHVFDGDEVSLVLVREAEFARPLWNFGMTSFADLGGNRLAATCWSGGRLEVALVEIDSGSWTPLDTGLTRLDNIAGSGDRIAIIGGDDLTAPGVMMIEQEGRITARIAGGDAPLAADHVSVARPMRFAGAGGDTERFALFYPPCNAAFRAPPDTAPPMVVSAHGGPTAMAKRGLDLEKQYWTSRGFAYLDVDYGGSFGYGRAYREALDGEWGRLDTADTLAAVGEALDLGLADPARIVATGSSAGGLTVLNALAASKLFAAGASLYGVADLAGLAAETHKFEAGYIFSLLGVDPDDADGLKRVCDERSPLARSDQISAPMIFLQGLDDAVVPPNQSESMAASLRTRGVPVAFITYEGEGHGFRNPDTVVSALQSSHAFFSRILGLAPGDDLPDIPIDNI